MCHVQRVTNTCGHINDHILLPCHDAKMALSEIESSGPLTGQTTYSAKDLQSAAFAAQYADKISRKGFDACSQPYCVDASIRELDSAEGFECMVSGCGQVPGGGGGSESG